MAFDRTANMINPGCQPLPWALDVTSDHILISAITAQEPKIMNMMTGTIWNRVVDLVLLRAYFRNAAVSLRGGFPGYGYALTVFIGFNDK